MRQYVSQRIASTYLTGLIIFLNVNNNFLNIFLTFRFEIISESLWHFYSLATQA